MDRARLQSNYSSPHTTVKVRNEQIMSRKVYQELASTIGALMRCEASEQSAADETMEAHWREMRADHRTYIEALVKHFFPSGSGWDNGTKLDYANSHEDRLTFFGSFHHMNEQGYNGWSDHSITVKPSLAFDYHLRISGRDRNSIKEYLGELFSAALDSDVESFKEDRRKEIYIEANSQFFYDNAGYSYKAWNPKADERFKLKDWAAYRKIFGSCNWQWLIVNSFDPESKVINAEHYNAGRTGELYQIPIDLAQLPKGFETEEEGKKRCSREMAAAEYEAKKRNWTYAWFEDWSIGSHIKEYGEAYESEPDTCELCQLFNEEDQPIQTLGCIDNATAEYRRVVEAELALEALATV